ncbi:MAG: glycosyltransferase family 2 protein [Tepidisphaeraceae bacterium]
MTLSVIVVTLNRPDCVRRCLTRLVAQDPLPDQVIVVDASADDLTRDVVREFPGVLYLRNENGFGRMTRSRNIGLERAKGDIIAFLDDDAFAHDGWSANLLQTYRDGGAEVGAVGGRALNNNPGEDKQGVDRIGKLSRSGSLTGYFAADPGRVIEVDHVMGCNMSYRREVIARLGGFREDYPGISGLREDSDMCLRVKRLGYRILFNPLAVVDHLGAPQAVGKRFDLRYAYFSHRNHMVLLARNFGLVSGVLWRGIIRESFDAAVECAKRIAGAAARLFVQAAGTVVGLIGAVMLLIKTGRDPVRHDAEGRKLTAMLSRGADLRPPASVDRAAVVASESNGVASQQQEAACASYS